MVGDYISREAAIAMLHDTEIKGYPEWNVSLERGARNLESIPAADVVPVVRCGECKHRDPEDRKCDCGGLEHAHMFPVADDWFCADGEKREVEHD